MPVVSTTNFTEKTFDYIIVGGGTTGISLAVRLSENPNISVGVLEAGGYDPNVPQINTPGLHGTIIANPKYDWTFMSTPQPQVDNRQILQPRGKALGGSSMLNFQCLFRPTKTEYDAIEKLGNQGWNWNELLECHKNSETTLPNPMSPEDSVKYAIGPNPEFHGTDGPIVKSLPLRSTELHARLLDSLESRGVPRILEHSGGSLVGGFTIYASIDARTATRSYAASGYFEPNKDRPNLSVITEAYVTKLLLDDGPDGVKKVIGVEFLKDGATHATKAPARDVILTAGSFKTPHILELSGIGNKKILEKYGIESKIHLPGVGENLQDHIMVPTVVEVGDKYESLDTLADPEVFAKHSELYKEKQGYLAHLTAPAFAFVNSHKIATDAEIAKWRATAAEHYKRDVIAQAEVDESKGTQRGFEKNFALLDEWLSDASLPQIEIMHFSGHYPLSTSKPDPSKRYSTLLCAISHPYSRGTVHLTSADPNVQPALEVNYFANPVDLDILARGIDFTLRLWETDADGKGLKTAVKGFVAPADLPDSGEERVEKIKAHIRTHVGPTYHPVGTVAMLPKEDGGVVSSDLKVYGTSNLRVADVSILPFELSSHIQSTAYAVAEKAAKIIKASQ